MPSSSPLPSPSLTWTPRGTGFEATHRRGTVMVAPSARSPGRWAAIDIEGGLLGPPTAPTEEAGRSWPTIEEAKAACAASLAPRKAGRKPTGVQRFVLHLHPDTMTRAREEGIGRGLTCSQMVQAILAEHYGRAKP